MSHYEQILSVRADRYVHSFVVWDLEQDRAGDDEFVARVKAAALKT
jgi:hypothetical protein